MSLNELENLVQGDGPGETSSRPIVVVIDDDPIIRASLEKVLKDKYEVRLCADGIEGTRVVDVNVSCVILDVRMPTHDGFWVCKHLRNRVPDVPIIFHSAYQDVKDPYEIINEFHPFGYVVKGDTLAMLLALVASAVKHSERLQETRRTVDRLRDARNRIRDVQEHLSKVSGSPRESERPKK